MCPADLVLFQPQDVSMNSHLLSLRSCLFDGPFAETVRYVPHIAGQPIDALRVIRSHDDAGDLGVSGTARRATRFEIAQGALDRPPQKGDAVEASDGIWRVIEVKRHPEIGAWIVNVEDGRHA